MILMWISPVRDRSPLATVRRLWCLISNGVREFEGNNLVSLMG